MTGVTALNLARAQFAFTISFHFIFPAFTIGLSSYLAVLEALWLKTGEKVYDNLRLAAQAAPVDDRYLVGKRSRAWNRRYADPNGDHGGTGSIGHHA